MSQPIDTSNNDSLSTLLEHLKEEIENWELEPGAPTTEDAETIRYGLYLFAMDILLCETRSRDGYAYYQALNAPAKLSSRDYEAFRAQLKPFIVWLEQINLKRVDDLTKNGMTEADAIATVIAADQTLIQKWLGELATDKSV